ncbi:hypothetical protein EDB84DRAFT_1549042, partial [Lactarius hengduanensis]
SFFFLSISVTLLGLSAARPAQTQIVATFLRRPFISSRIRLAWPWESWGCWVGLAWSSGPSMQRSCFASLSTLAMARTISSANLGVLHLQCEPSVYRSRAYFGLSSK